MIPKIEDQISHNTRTFKNVGQSKNKKLKNLLITNLN